MNALGLRVLSFHVIVLFLHEPTMDVCTFPTDNDISWDQVVHESWSLGKNLDAEI